MILLETKHCRLFLTNQRNTLQTISGKKTLQTIFDEATEHTTNHQRFTQYIKIVIKILPMPQHEIGPSILSDKHKRSLSCETTRHNRRKQNGWAGRHVYEVRWVGSMGMNTCDSIHILPLPAIHKYYDKNGLDRWCSN